ncbi:NAD(P)H-binding protein [Abyssibacter sp.]|uniref:NAD(P)H-binding protein n=1 Tax=Abyssibacter sp. TaxID=2320200 RepID=UPI0025BE3964|nr:NAD(P)H-binding protein [Abyssibacter sp.]MCK5859682.1 NAD(P)H-binding protein [Abyssibacter sp.]
MPEVESGSVAVLGATGAVGRAVCRQLATLGSPGHAIVRRPTEAVEGFPARVVDFARAVDLTDALRVTRVICCLGTTQAKAGRDGLRAVDRDLVLHCAERASRAGAEVFTVVSAVGASRRSLSFYSRVKGEMENGLSRIRLDTVHIVRPSLLLGDRDETRPAEAVSQLIAPLINPVLPLRYRAISVDAVARALIQLSGPSTPGVWLHELPLGGRRSRRLDA